MLHELNFQIKRIQDLKRFTFLYQAEEKALETKISYSLPTNPLKNLTIDKAYERYR
jgi:hypothetical protein